MIGIYKIESPSGRVYVGQSIDIERRFKTYNISKDPKIKQQRKLYRSLQKYGAEAHNFSIIEECLLEDLNTRERFWQEFYDVLSSKGLNCVYQSCEDKSGKLSEETKRKVSESLKGRETWNKGIPNTEEHKKNQSLALKGRYPWNKGLPMTEEQKQRQEKTILKKGHIPWNKGSKVNYPNGMSKKVIDTETQEIFDSMSKAAEKYGIKSRTLSDMLRGVSKNKTNLKYLDNN